MFRPLLSADGPPVELPVPVVSPESMLRPLLSDEVPLADWLPAHGVVGVYAPAFVERPQVRVPPQRAGCVAGV